MTKEEYTEALKKLKEENTKKIIALNKKYALDNNKIMTGDFLEDHNFIIKVNQISYTMGFDSFPYCVFIGSKYTKKLSKYKSGETGIIHEHNIKKHWRAD